jgi:exosortase family protein XrtM
VNKQKKKMQSGLSWEALTSEWRSWLAGKGPVLIFAAKFGGLILLLYAILAFPFSDRILYSYLEANAWVSNLILNGFGQGTHVNEVTIQSPEFAIAIHRGCDAVEPTWLLCAAILAFPGAFRQKLFGMLAGIVGLQLLNLVRIVSLYLIGSHFPAFFPSAHLEIWPTIFILTAIVFFVGWKGWSIEE